MNSEGLLRVFNYAECGLWLVVAAVFGICLVAGRVRPRFRLQGTVLAVTFAVFGLTDIFEVHSGAWWEPWWLGTIKAGCVAIFVLAGLRYWRLRH